MATSNPLAQTEKPRPAIPQLLAAIGGKLLGAFFNNYLQTNAYQISAPITGRKTTSP